MDKNNVIFAADRFAEKESARRFLIAKFLSECCQNGLMRIGEGDPFPMPDKIEILSNIFSASRSIEVLFQLSENEDPDVIFVRLDGSNIKAEIREGE